MSRYGSRTERRRARFRRADDDPLSLLVNFFDCSLVFALGLVVTLGIARKNPDDRESEARAHEAVDASAKALPKYRVSTEQKRGPGTRLGTAYQLPGGEVVYVPDDSKQK